MKQDLTNKVAYITGGSKGIGFGIAQTLLELGMNIAISSRSLKAAQDAASELSNHDKRILAVESDVASFEAEQKAIAAVVKHFRKLDVLIANAGVGHFAPVDELSIEDWNATINTNLTGVFH